MQFFTGSYHGLHYFRYLEYFAKHFLKDDQQRAGFNCVAQRVLEQRGLEATTEEMRLGGTLGGGSCTNLPEVPRCHSDGAVGGLNFG